MSSSPARTAAFFDLDKTIIAKSSTLAFSTKFQAGGLLSRRAMLRSAYAQLLFRIGGSLVGLECHYFFGKRKKPTARQTEEPVQMILCPKF